MVSPGPDCFYFFMSWRIQVWAESFRSKLSIREKSHHSTCSVCVKHKLILKGLKGDRIAHQRQSEWYGQHIAAQYKDRCVYWECRSESRLNLTSNGTRTIQVVIDGMDKSKFLFPRALSMGAKEFGQFHRPSLDVHAIITHGHSLGVYLSDPMVPKDSSWCNDLLSFTLHELGSEVELRQCKLVCQSDNTSKEVKNNTTLRVLAYYVANCRLFSAESRHLRTGHSHEDVDGLFSQFAGLLEKHNELHVPAHFQDVLNQYLQLPSTRPYEARKWVMMVNTVRDWRFGRMS